MSAIDATPGGGVAAAPRGRATRERRARRQRRMLAVGLLAPTLALLVCLFLYPLLGIVLRSLSAEGNLSYLSPAVDFGNYMALVHDHGFRRILLNTFQIALYTTGICVVIGYPVAYVLASLSRKAAGVLLLLIMVPFWLSILVRLYAWTVILGPQGVINKTGMNLGLISEPLPLLFNQSSVVIGMVNYLLPYMVLILYSAMLSIDRRLIDAAYSMGASPFYMFRKVFFPLSLSGVYAGALLVFIISLGYFVTPAVLGGSAITIPMYIQQQAEILEWGSASAMGVVLLAITIVLFIAFNRMFGLERLVRGVDR